MSENNSSRTRQLLLTGLLTSLLAIIGFQTWYLMNMQQQLDTIQNSHDRTAAVMKPENLVSLTAQTKQPKKSPQKQQDFNTPLPPVQQGQSMQGQSMQGQSIQGQSTRGRSLPTDQPSAFDDDFFTRPFFGRDWDPHEEIARMQREMDRTFSNMFSRFDQGSGFDRLTRNAAPVTQMKMQEDDAKYTVTVDLPGTDGNDISVNLDGQQLTLKGEQEFNEEKKDAMGNVIYQQHRTGQFQRSITLPEPVEQNGMTTHVDDGVLTITIPKVS